jgi:hypothetical protein
VKSADAQQIMIKQGAECATNPEINEALQKNIKSFELLKSKFADGVVPDEQFVNIEEVDEAGSDMSDIKTQMSELTEIVKGLAKNAKPKETKTDDDADGDADEAKKAEELAKAAAPIAATIASEALAGIQVRLSSLMAKLDSGVSVSREEADEAFGDTWEVRNMISLASTSMAKSDDAPKQPVIDAAVEMLTKNIKDENKKSDDEKAEKAKAELEKAELEKSAPVGFSMDLSPALPGNDE